TPQLKAIKAEIWIIFTKHIGTVWFDDFVLSPYPKLITQCPDGYYYTELYGFKCNYCEQGYYCVGGGKYKCEQGMFSYGGQSKCSPCLRGWICENGISRPCKRTEFTLNSTCM